MVSGDPVRLAVRYWEESGVPARHGKRTKDELLGSPEWLACMTTAMACVVKNGVVLLAGDRGNGKTQAGVECIRAICREAKPALYIKRRHLGMALREAYRDGARQTERDALRQFARPRLLVIDECHEVPEKEFERMALTDVVDTRYADGGKPTVLIANCNQHAIRDLFGDSIVDRTAEGGGLVWFGFKSFRSGL